MSSSTSQKENTNDIPPPPIPVLIYESDEWDLHQAAVAAKKMETINPNQYLADFDVSEHDLSATNSKTTENHLEEHKHEKDTSVETSTLASSAASSNSEAKVSDSTEDSSKNMFTQLDDIPEEDEDQEIQES